MRQSELSNSQRGTKGGFTFIVKPTNACNLDCKYCYDKPIRKLMPNTKMSLEMFEHIAMLTNKYVDKANILWHGGEATLMGHEFYYEANKILSKYYMTEFTQQMQTNGTLVYSDKRWIETFKDCGIQPGTSYDATYQYMREGTGEDTMRTVMEDLANNGLGGVGGITIIHNDNLFNMIDMYEFIKQEFKGDFSLCFNLGFMTDETQDAVFDMNPDDVFNGYKKFFDYLLLDTSNVCMYEQNHIRSLKALIKPYLGKGCEFIDCRTHWITAIADGTLIPCSRFSVFHTFGNVMDYESIEDIINSEGFKRYSNSVTERHKRLCKDCKIYDKCYGGCPAKFARNSITPEETQCAYIKAQFLSAYSSWQDVPVNVPLNPKAVNEMKKFALFHPYHVFRFINEQYDLSINYKIDITTLDINTFVSTKQFRILELLNSTHLRSYDVDTSLSLEESYTTVKRYLLNEFKEVKSLVEDIINE